MIIDDYKKLKGKTFLIKIGSYNNFGGAETQSLILVHLLKVALSIRIFFYCNKIIN